MRRKICGAVRHLSYRNISNGLMEIRKRKSKISLFLTTTPLSEDNELMNYYDMIDGTKNYKYLQDDYTNQFHIEFTKEELLELQDLINKKVKQLNLKDTNCVEDVA